MAYYQPIKDPELKRRLNPDNIAFTCIAAANLRCSDSPSEPTPVHYECWEHYGISGGFTRVKADRFVVSGPAESGSIFESRGHWVGPHLPENTKCYLCGEVI